MNKKSPETFANTSMVSVASSGYKSAAYDEVEYWSSYSPKCEECKVMLKQLRQMKQTVRTLININQDQYWAMVDFKEDSERLATELQEAKWRVRLLEAELSRVKAGSKMAVPEKSPQKVEVTPADSYIAKQHNQLKSQINLSDYERDFELIPATDTLTERIKELMNSSMERPVNIPFKFDAFSMEQRTGPLEAVRASEYKALANIFVGTAAIDDKPQMTEQELPLEKRLEKDLREGIVEKDVQRIAETLLKIKEEKLQDTVDVDLAQRKLEELLTTHSEMIDSN